MAFKFVQENYKFIWNNFVWSFPRRFLKQIYKQKPTKSYNSTIFL